MFNVTIFNDGFWTTVEVATSLGMRLTSNGNYRGWIKREDIDRLEKKGIRFTVW